MVACAKGYNLRILGYHSVTDGPSPLSDWCHLDASDFEDQMCWLAAQDVDVLPLNQAVCAANEGHLKRNSVSITFDDGYRNNVEVALPILKKCNFPATFFLTTGPILRNQKLWNDRIISALERTEKRSISWCGSTFEIFDLEEKKRANSKLQALVKIRSPENPELAAREIERLLSVGEEVKASINSPHSMLSRDNIRAALESGLISFGAHTVTHPLLSSLGNEQLEEEINGSIDSLEDLTGQQCRSFAYPNGRSCDFDERAIALLQARSVDLAVTAEDGPNYSGADPFRLRRWLIGNPTEISTFRALLPKYNVPALHESR